MDYANYENDIPDQEQTYAPENLKARVFYLRFFLRWTYADIAMDLSIPEKDAAKHFYAAKKRIDEILKYLDRTKKANFLVRYKGRFNDNQKMFILKHVMGLTCLQIAELFNNAISTKTIEERVRKLAKKYEANFAMNAS